MKKTGIDCIAYYVPPIYLDITRLARERGIEPAKLTKGLGLTAMALCDADEDTVTMAARAALKLIEDNRIDPRTVGRLYLGTESALDASKPTATYVGRLLEEMLRDRYGDRCLKNCDVLDMTFACVGAVDALHNCIDWVRGDSSRKAIVLAADFAKYALASAGEYTQGAGAVAMLVSDSPRLLSLAGDFGVGTQSVGDFYKPQHAFSKRGLLAVALEAAGLPADRGSLDKALEKLSADAFWGHPDVRVLLHRDEPVFDGPYSNDCYRARMSEALDDFSAKQPLNVLDDWDYLVFHQPYAYQGRRMIVSDWVDWMKQKGRLSEIEQQAGVAFTPDDSAGFYKAAAKTAAYMDFVERRIARGERASSLVGNLYTASIFLSLISLLRSLHEEAVDAEGQSIGCLSYGSGSKSKVFRLRIECGWKEAMEKNDVFSDLKNRQSIDFETYESLHKGALETPVVADKPIAFKGTGDTPVTEGLRYYRTKK